MIMQFLKFMIFLFYIIQNFFILTQALKEGVVFKPQFNNSETLGSSLYIPYFKTLGDDMDLTFKPTMFEKLKSFKKKNILVN